MRNGLTVLALVLSMAGCGGSTPDSPMEAEPPQTVTIEWEGHTIASSWDPESSTAKTTVSVSSQPDQVVYAIVDLERRLFLSPDGAGQLDFEASWSAGTDALLNALNLAVHNAMVRNGAESGDGPGCDMLTEPTDQQMVCCAEEDACSFQHRCELESWTSNQGGGECDACNLAFVQCLAGSGPKRNAAFVAHEGDGVGS